MRDDPRPDLGEVEKRLHGVSEEGGRGRGRVRPVVMCEESQIRKR